MQRPTMASRWQISLMQYQGRHIRGHEDRKKTKKAKGNIITCSWV